MKQFLALSILVLSSGAVYAQTAPTQSATNPTAASDNAISNHPSPTTGQAKVETATKPAATEVDQPTTPTVKTFPQAPAEEVDPRIAVPPLPKKKLSLIGGTVRDIDPIRNHMTVMVYHGKPMHVIFDDRTKVTRDGGEISSMNIRKNDRVYLDTQLYQQKIYAKQIQIVTKVDAADLNGQVVNFNPRTRVLELRDNLSARSFQFTVDNDAAVTANGGKAATIADLQPGALVTAHFNAGQTGRGTIRDIAILAAPGAEFTLYGPVNHVDLRSGRLAVQNKADDKAYEVKFDPAQFSLNDLVMGSEVAVTAKFDGQDYVAQSLNVTAGPRAAETTMKVESDKDQAGAEAGVEGDRDAKKKNKKDKKEQTGNEDEQSQNPK